MKTQLTLLSAVLVALQGCATAPEGTLSIESDLSTVLPPPAAGFPAAPLTFPSPQAAEKALTGYNYGLVNQPDGSVQAFVSGYVGSGADNVVTPNSAIEQYTATATEEQVTGGAEMAFPEIKLTKKLNGQAALDALGDKIGSVAKAYNMSPERLQEILTTDSTAWIDESGRLLYIDSHQDIPEDQGEEVEELATATVTNANSDAASVAATTEPFLLHSKPGSNRVIYLDFNGHVATNTAWYTGSLNAQAYDIDSNPAAFNATELNNIKNIWQRVAEDYAPFDVDVTTEELSAGDLQRTSSSDAKYGTRVVITRSMPELCSQACGGVAYVNVFAYYSSSTPDRYQPAWIFFDKLGNGYPKYVAEAVSHEVGHNLNLNHDGNATTGYYSGHGSGATGWAPIMGVGYYKPVTQWSKGEYPGANNQQDDIAVIHAAGANLRADDYANSIAAASTLGGDANVVNQAGIIERTTDADTFAFSAGEGVAQFTVTPDPIAPNLDVMLKILDAQGKLVAQADPATTLSASLSVSLLQGQYFLQVEGVGAGDLTTGYSDYGSLGRYQISGSYEPFVNPAIAPTPMISATPTFGDAPLHVTLDGGNSSDSDGNIVAYNWSFGDGTSASGSAAATHIYQQAGTYVATLTVTDDSGLQASTTQDIQVTQAPIPTGMKVTSTSLIKKVKRTSAHCVAQVNVEYDGSKVVGASISGTWSGSVSSRSGKIVLQGDAQAVTNNQGVAYFVSQTIPAKSNGSCAFTVSDVVKSGYSYNASGDITSSYSW